VLLLVDGWGMSPAGCRIVVTVMPLHGHRSDSLRPRSLGESSTACVCGSCS
jgi:hypothetical protein